MNEPQSFLARHQATPALNESEMRAFARWVWHERGIPVFLNIEEIPDHGKREAVQSAAVQLYGERQPG